MAENINDFLKKYSITGNILEEKFYGRNIYLLGTAEFGAVNDPRLIESIEEFKYYFGESGTLYEAFKAIKSVSSTSKIYINKISGTHSSLYLNLKDNSDMLVENALYIKAKEANEAYNLINISLSETAFKITLPGSLGAKVIEYDLTKYKYLGSLVKAINSDAENSSGKVYAYTDSEYFLETKNLYLSNQISLNLQGGNSEISLNKNTLYDRLKESLNLLEGLDIDIIIPVNAFLDDAILTLESPSRFFNRSDYLSKTENSIKLTYYDILLEFCVKQLKFGLITHGIIGVNPVDNTLFKAYRSEYINDVLKLSLTQSIKNSIYRDYSYLVSVCAGDVQNLISFNSYLAYGAVLSETLITLTTTNAKAENISLVTVFKEEELKALADMGITAFRYSVFKKGVVVYSGVTSKTYGHDLHFISNVRMIQLAINFIKSQINSLLGESMDKIYKNSYLHKIISYLLDFLISKNLITEYNINISYDSKFQDMLSILVELKTIYMKEYIKTSNVLYIGED